MILLVCFDLSRETKLDRKKANRYRERLLELGFKMKQFSLYERYVSTTQKKNKLLAILKMEIPDSGVITLYLLPDDVHNSQVTILGKDVELIKDHEPKLIFL